MTTVIQFISSLSDGGAETLVKDYALFFDKRKDLNIRNIIVVVNNFTKSANYKRLANTNVEIIAIYNKYSILNSILRECFGKFYIPYKLGKILKKYNPDCIHVHLALLKYLLPLHRKMQSLKLFYTCHTLPKLLFSNKNKEEGKAADFLIKRNNLKMIVLHEDMANEVNHRFAINNATIIKNGIDISRFRNVKEKKMAIRDSLGIPKNAFVVGHVGRFSEPKNHRFLIKIFGKLLKYRDDAYLLLIGNGPLFHEIKESSKTMGISDRILFLSHRTDTPQLFKAMDVFVFPSLYEGLPVTLVEAQAAQLKCVISDRITKQIILSPKTLVCSLAAPIDTWCKFILDEDIENEDYGDIMEYDMNMEIVKLAELYRE